VLISSAGHMNIQAQNALLKELEEPADNTFFILMARDTAMLLPTIKSRCRHLQFKPLTGRALADHLSAAFQADPQSARIAAATAGPDPTLAMTLLNLVHAGDHKTPALEDRTKTPVDWQATRTWIIEQLSAIISGPAAEKKIDIALSLSWQMSLNPDDILPGLAVMRSFFRDLCVFKHAPEKILNLDFLEIFEDIGWQVDDKQCLTWMTAVHETEKRLESNSSVRMTMDRFFLAVIHI
ncbi:MAG: DNA polymerase III subunit delta', partial [Desulfobacteraceae bacterium]|nr:DNA polymerase III subunit delta' [Desulfobacteraceae bacterium]